MFWLWLFFLLKILIIQTLNKSACCFLTWLSLAPFELKNNGQWLQGMEPSGIIPCEADICLLRQNVLHKLCPHISHILVLCILYVWGFRAYGVPIAVHCALSSHRISLKFETNILSNWIQTHAHFVHVLTLTFLSFKNLNYSNFE